jgi:hypothetical protein
VNIVALVIAIVAALAAAMSAWYARNQVGEMRKQSEAMRTQSQEMQTQSQEMRNQVKEMQTQSQEMRNQVEETRREFELSGPYLQVKIGYEGKAAGAPLMVELTNNGRQAAHIADLIVRPYRQGFMVPGGFVPLPNPLLGPSLPMIIAPDDGVIWTFPWRWVTQQAEHLGFDAIRFELVRGNHTTIVSDPVSTSFVPFEKAPVAVKHGMEERKRLDEIIGPAIQAGRDAEAEKSGGSQSREKPNEAGEGE